MAAEWSKVTQAGGLNPKQPVHSALGGPGLVIVPPLSVLLDPKVPVVELEVERLQSALSWIYAAVKSLQKDGSALSADISRFEGTLRQWSESGAGAPRVATLAPGESELEALVGLVRQHEQKRIAEQKLLEMKVQSLGSAVDCRLQASDLEDLRRKTNERLEQIAGSYREDLQALASNLQAESANERRQLQFQFATLCSKVESQLELSRIGGDEQRLKVAVASAQLSAAAAAAAAASAAAAGTGGAKATEGGSPTRRPQLFSLASGLESLEKASFGVPIQVIPDGGFPGGGTPEILSRTPSHQTSLGGARSSSDQQRLERLETSVAALRSSSRAGGADAAGTPEVVPEVGEVGRQLVELHRVQTEAHHRLLEVHERLSNLEQGTGMVEPLSPGGAEAHGQAPWEPPLVEVQSRTDELSQVSTAQAGQLQQLTKTLSGIAQIISGDAMDFSDLQAATSGGAVDKLAWLEKRVKALFDKGHGKPIEQRLRQLETDKGAQEVAQRLETLEKVLRKVDLEELGQVPPQLVIIQHEAENFRKDLRQEVQELKVVVGCIEACVPKETRKAIQLFKRAAGSTGESQVSPRALARAGEILMLREDMETRLRAAEVTVSEQCENITSVVKGLERKQDMMEWKIEGRGPLSSSTSAKGSPLSAATPLNATFPRRPVADLTISAATTPASAPTDVSAPPKEVGSSPPAGWKQQQH